MGAALLALAAACESDAAPAAEGADVAAGDASGGAADLSEPADLALPADLAEPADLAAPADTTAPPATVCARRGGTCVPGFPDGDVPGFTVTCPEGSALDDGSTSTTNGGIDLIQSPLALGCSQNPDGTTTPALCCLPRGE